MVCAMPCCAARLSRLCCAPADGLSANKASWPVKFGSSLRKPIISKSDEEFLKTGVEFEWSAEGLSIAELNDLFEKVGVQHCTAKFALLTSRYAGWLPTA
jgi:hypothetical protein